MHRLPHPTIGRRALIRNGALTISLGALAAACGKGRTGVEAPGRLGLADEPPELPDAEIDDVTLMRTAQSLEYTALMVYEAAAGMDVLSSDEAALVQRFVEDHQRHADAVGEIVVRLGGEPFQCANPFLVERAVEPILDALEGSDDLRTDVLNTAYAFETLAGASYQAFVGMFMNEPLRASAMLIGSEEQRHAAALAVALNPEAYFSPALAGAQEDVDERGIAVRYAVPSTFSRVSGIDLIVGGLSAEGTRFATQLQTPAANSFVYSHQSC